MSGRGGQGQGQGQGRGRGRGERGQPPPTDAGRGHLQQFIKGRQLDVPQETLQLLDVVLREKPSNSCAVVGRSFFSPALGDVGELGNGLIYWKGFYQSLRPTQMGLSLNIDMSARAFFDPIPVLEYVCKYINKDVTRTGLSDQDRIKVEKALKGVRVETHHQGLRRHKISAITQLSSQKLMFPLDSTGTQISVAQYFLEKYNVALQFPLLPAIQAGSDTKPIYLPIELCSIVEGQRYSRKLNERQVTALLRATCQRPEDREKSITKMVAYNNYSQDELVNKEFGIQVKSEMTSLEARVLPPPMLKYHASGKESQVAPTVGQWNMIDKSYDEILMIEPSKGTLIEKGEINSSLDHASTSVQPANDANNGTQDAELEIPCKTISQIKHDGKIGHFWVYAEIVSIEDIGGSTYLLCTTCSSKLQTEGDIFFCQKCNSSDIEGRIRHRLTLQVADKNGCATFQVWERECMQFLGKTVEQIEEYGKINHLPIDIEDLVNKKALFKVQVKEGETKDFKGSYSVSKVISDSDEITKYCDYMPTKGCDETLMIEPSKETMIENEKDNSSLNPTCIIVEPATDE